MDLRRTEVLEARNKYYTRMSTEGNSGTSDQVSTQVTPIDPITNIHATPTTNTISIGDIPIGEPPQSNAVEDVADCSQTIETVGDISHDIIEINSDAEGDSDDDIRITDVRETTPHEDIVEMSWGNVDDEEDDDIQIVDERPLLQPRNFTRQQGRNYHQHVHNRRNPQRGYNPNPFDTITEQGISNLLRGQTPTNLIQVLGAAYRTHFPNGTPFGSHAHFHEHIQHHLHNLPPNPVHQRMLELMFISDEDDPDYTDPDQIDNAIMNRIEQEAEDVLDRRLVSENLNNRKTLDEKKEAAHKTLEGYTTTISPEKELGCEVCGVILGLGIPLDFKVDHRYNKNIVNYIKHYRVLAPWFCQTQITQLDRDLSKRIFASKCGHAYCGRCVKNIGNKPKRTRLREITITNPHVYAPIKCPGDECQRKLTPKSFVEVYY